MAASRDPDGDKIKELIDFLTKTLRREDLKRLITDSEDWKALVEGAHLSREEEAAVRDALNEHLAQEPTDEDDETQREMENKRFLEEFPKLKRNLEGHIRKLRDLADHLDKVHRDCTISNVVADSTGTASGVLGILGIALAPFTAGASLALTATSLGLGAAAAVTSVTTSIVEKSNRGSDKADAEKVVKASMDTLHDILKIIPSISVKHYTIRKDVGRDSKPNRHHVLKSVAGTWSLYCTARMARGVKFAKGLKVARGLKVTRGFRFASIGLTGLMLGIDVYNLVNSSMDLYDGAKTESAGTLRDLAQKLEEKLQEIDQIHMLCSQTYFSDASVSS